jgi:ribosome-associated protein
MGSGAGDGDRIGHHPRGGQARRRLRSNTVMNPPQDFALRGDHITLDALLKATGLASSGGAAKMLIAEGGVQVNGQTETRRGRKLRAGDEVALAGARLHIVAPDNAPDGAPDTPP